MKYLNCCIIACKIILEFKPYKINNCILQKNYYIFEILAILETLFSPNINQLCNWEHDKNEIYQYSSQYKPIIIGEEVWNNTFTPWLNNTKVI